MSNLSLNIAFIVKAYLFMSKPSIYLLTKAIINSLNDSIPNAFTISSTILSAFKCKYLFTCLLSNAITLPEADGHLPPVDFIFSRIVKFNWKFKYFDILSIIGLGSIWSIIFS